MMNPERIKKSLPKALALALGLVGGNLIGSAIWEYVPRVFENSYSDKLTGIGYQITPNIDRRNILEVRTDKFPNWAGWLLAPNSLSLAEKRIARVCFGDIYEPFFGVRVRDVNAETVTLHQLYQLENPESCFTH